MKSINTDITELKSRAMQFISESSDYEPLDKARKAFGYSAVVFILSLLAGIISLIKYKEYLEISLMVMIVCIFCLVFSLIAGVKMIKDLDAGKIRSLVITVIKAGKINLARKIEAVTDDEENVTFTIESDIAVKKDRKYKVYFYERDEELIITYAKQVSANKKMKD